MSLPSLCFYFHVHQPVRLKRFSVFENHPKNLFERYFDWAANEFYFEKAAKQCYLPATEILLDKINEEESIGRKFKLSFSITGVFLDQCEKFAIGRKVLENFQQLAKTGNVEFVNETYYHSLSSLYNIHEEFVDQVKLHWNKISDTFGQKPKAFRNTELLYNNEIAGLVQKMGFKAILAEGADHLLGWRSPNYVYAPNLKNSKAKLLLRNYKLSDDIGYRFSAKWWPEYPLTSEKYVSWLLKNPGDTANIFMDFETFGEHHWKDTGILDFLHALPSKALDAGLKFKTVSETANSYEAKDKLDCKTATSWADLERDASAWLGNEMQREAFKEVQKIESHAKRSSSQHEFLKAFRLLQTSDHFYYICTKNWSDGDVHKYFAHHKTFSPYDSFINFMNILQDFKAITKKANIENHGSKYKQLEEMVRKLKAN